MKSVLAGLTVLMVAGCAGVVAPPLVVVGPSEAMATSR